MLKDYYKILRVSRNASAEDIKTAYRMMSMKWHPDKNPDANVTSIMQEINEAYAILKDQKKRERYDKEYDKFFEQFFPIHYEHSTDNSYEYDYEIQDEVLRDNIADARQYAKELVDEFFKSFKKASCDAANGAWQSAKSYIYVGIFLLIFGGLVSTCIRNNDNNDGYSYSYSTGYQERPDSPSYETAIENETIHNTEFAQVFHVPESWTHYVIDNSFSISIPSTVELRKEYDDYTKALKDIGKACNSNIVVFQQKGLSSNTAEAYSRYCRIMIQHSIGKTDEFLRHNQIEIIDSNIKTLFRELVLAELGNFSLLCEPSYKWIDIYGTKAVEIKYRRSGSDNNTTCCKMYLFFNYDEMTKMIVSYREQEKELWQADLDKVIKTFKWKQTK